MHPFPFVLQVCKAYVGEVDWKIGTGLLLEYDAIRYFDNPMRDNLSIANSDDFKEGMNTHYSCGVFNRFFYCLVEVT